MLEYLRSSVHPLPVQSRPGKCSFSFYSPVFGLGVCFLTYMSFV
jgi:hypothetical protein